MTEKAEQQTSPFASSQPSTSSRNLAYLGMFVCALIYGSNFALSRHAVLNGLTTNDIVALRFATAGLLLLPVFLKAGGFRTCAGVGWPRGLLITLLSGLPMTLLMIGGLSLAPAAHGASITPGTVMVISAVGSVVLLGAALTRNLVVGIAIVLVGLTCIGLASSTGGGPDMIKGDLMFLAAGLVWGSYPLFLQHWKMDGLVATAILSVVSMVIFLPWYIAFADTQITSVPLGVIAFHAINQGVLNVVVGLWIWAWAARIIGASVAGRFPALIPIIGTLAAIPVLGEVPKALQLIGMGLIVTGLALSAWKR